MIKHTVLVLFVFFLGSCASQKVIFEERARTNIGSGYSSNNSFFLWGALQTQQSSPLYMCDNIENVYAIEGNKSAENVFLNIITGGMVQVHLYTPRQSTIYCKKN
jgi:hypothetical protein